MNVIVKNWGTAVNNQTYRYETVKLIASDRASGDSLGSIFGISISGNYAIAGTQLKNNKTGSAYLFYETIMVIGELP